MEIKIIGTNCSNGIKLKKWFQDLLVIMTMISILKY